MEIKVARLGWAAEGVWAFIVAMNHRYYLCGWLALLVVGWWVGWLGCHIYHLGVSAPSLLFGRAGGKARSKYQWISFAHLFTPLLTSHISSIVARRISSLASAESGSGVGKSSSYHITIIAFLIPISHSHSHCGRITWYTSVHLSQRTGPAGSWPRIISSRTHRIPRASLALPTRQKLPKRLQC